MDAVSAPPAATMIELRDIVKDYRGRRALDRISCQLPAGVVGLLGPNGAGKTTLIKILLGVIQASSGSGSIMGLPLRDRRARAEIGFMPEDDCFIPNISGVEMVQMAARLSGLPSLEALRRAHETLDFCGMEQERYRAVETYSTGMRQKLKFAQAIVHDPTMLILDEPTASLDPSERRGMLHRMNMLARKHGKSLLLSTHILPDVQQICDYIVILSRGKMRLQGPLDELDRSTATFTRVTVTQDAEKLLDVLRGHGLNARLEADGALMVEGVAEKDTTRFWQWAKEAGATLRSVGAIRQSLDDIFFDAVREHDDAAA